MSQLKHTQSPTVTELLAQDPTAKVSDVVAQAFPHKTLDKLITKLKLNKGVDVQHDITPHDLDAAAASGAFPSRPSELFLKVSSRSCLRLLSAAQPEERTPDQMNAIRRQAFRFQKRLSQSMLTGLFNAVRHRCITRRCARLRRIRSPVSSRRR